MAVRFLAWVFLGAMLTLPAAADALAWRDADGFRAAPVNPKPGQRPVGFTRLPATATGVTFTNALAQSRYVTNQIYLNGAGVAAGDIDNDGLCDLFFCGLDHPNVLYRNRGDWRFEDVTAGSGTALAGLSCTGAVFADLDGDGDLDLVVNTVGEGTLVRFNDGRGRFTDRSAGSPLNYLRAGMTSALADVDGDGDLDLYVANYRTTTIRDMPNTRMRLREEQGEVVVVAVNDRPTTDADLVGRFLASRDGRIVENGEPDVLYRNDGQGRFTVVPFTGGAFLDEDGQPLPSPLYDWGLTATFRDLDGDGTPDLYVCNDFESPDRLWLNRGDGTFRAIPRLALRHTSIFSMGVDFADLNRDGHLDFFVSDMLSRDHAKRMLENGEIQPTILPVGAIDNRPQYSHNTLFLNCGDLTFTEISQLAGVHASEWTWSPNFLDVDLDGYEDLLITTGHELQMMNTDIIDQAEVLKTQKVMSSHELQRLRTLFPRYAIPNVAFRNRGDLTFEEVSAAWGFDFPDIGNAVALADLDNDGDLDVAINNLNGVAELCRNETTAPRVAVRLLGLPPNTQGIGARIIVRGGPVPQQQQEIIAGGRYLSGGEAIRVFAAGSAQARLTIEVRWRSGRRSVVTDALPNHVYELAEAAAAPTPSPAEPSTGPADDRPSTWFVDESARLDHRHVEEPFDDFERQPLLPHKLSQLGPGVSWTDLDNDGWDDLVLTSGRSGRLEVFRNLANGGFAPLTNAALLKRVARDQTTALGFGAALLVGSSNYEDGLTNGGAIRVYDLSSGASGESVLGPTASTGPLAAADYDNDGDLDLFIGGRVIPGHYPAPATSLLLRREGPRLIIDQRFEQLGLVSGATFSDLDGDGTPELLVACEWGPLRIFRRRDGRYVEWNPPLRAAPPERSPLDPALRHLCGAPLVGVAALPAAGDPSGGGAGFQPAGVLGGGAGFQPAGARSPTTLRDLTGWWTAVATGDLDGDGRLDLVAANWGLNSRQRPARALPIRIHYGDLDDNGFIDVIETTVNPANGLEVPTRGLRAIRAAIPFVQGRIASFEAYGLASLTEVYGDSLAVAQRVEAIEWASLVFLNRGDHFEVAPLPLEAQFAPAFGLGIADFDGDGHEDVVLSQNFFAVNPEAWRMDGGRGLLLRGEGTGRLVPIPGQESGIKIYGEQRGCAVADYDGDGRTDVVITQNANATVLLRNQKAQPGLRIRLTGGADNPHAVGATLRLKTSDGYGPAREVQAGSGYWSQHSTVSVLASRGQATHVWVRWPGGQVTESPLPSEAREIRVRPDGTVTQLK
jgi:hypothetical protein